MTDGTEVAPASPATRAPLSERFRRFYHENEPLCTAGLFVVGFLFDTLAVGRIDELHNILHQGTYLTLCALFIGYELRERHGDFAPPDRLKNVWRYRNGATHFMLGTLLNIYTLFYFKSASIGVSLLFLGVMAGLLAANELKPFGSGTTLRVVLFSLCLISYFTYLVPTLAGSIGVLPFMGTLAAASAAVGLLAWRLVPRLANGVETVKSELLVPFGAVLLTFAGLYFLKVIPPVPLSLEEIGIYHKIERNGKDFVLTTTRPRWKFWQKGDQTFLARPNDSVYCYISVFSPTRFKERLQVRWARRDESGWSDADAIPLDIAGGRDGGWRGFTVKAKWKPGPWRVRVETSDGRELGRVALSVVPDEETAPRDERTLVR